MVLGGLVTALALARGARETDVNAYVTTTVTSAVAVTAALHLAAAVENNLAHGLATSAWLDGDVSNRRAGRRGVAAWRFPWAGSIPTRKLTFRETIS